MTIAHSYSVFPLARPLIEQTRSSKKALDKSIRQLEKLYQFADKNLKAKDDKRWKDNKLREFKNLIQLLEDFHEAINPAMPLQFKQIEKSAIYWLHQIEWCQERFPNAVYEDVTGLCKLATLEEIQEQDYSLNPGRYVGVVIEEDGMTEEEFFSVISGCSEKLKFLNESANNLENLIQANLSSLVNEE